MEDSSDFNGDYETLPEYEPSVPWPRRCPYDDDLDYEPSEDNEVCMHIHYK